MLDLKPCPFCGAMPWVETQKGGDVFVNDCGFLEVGKTNKDLYTVLCCCEDRHIAWHENRGMAMLAWNRWVTRQNEAYDAKKGDDK